MGDIAPRTREGAEFEGNRGSVVIELRSKFLKVDESNEVNEQLLPGIPDEITLECVAPKLPWIAFHMLSSVSRGWQQAIRSHQVYDARVRTQSTETLVLMIHDHANNQRVLPQALSLYSLSDGSCYHLPLIPGFRNGLPCHCEFCFLDGKLYALGGYDNSSPPQFSYNQMSAKVYVLDLAGQRPWKECASMGERKDDFRCSAVSGKIYAVGGLSSRSFRSDHIRSVYCGSEFYDPAADAWSPIAQMEHLGSNQMAFTMGEELFAHNLFDTDFPPRPLSYIYKAFNPLQIYNPLKHQWRTVDHMMQYMDILFSVGGKLHKLAGRYDSHGISVFDDSANSWKPSQSSSFRALGRRGSFRVSIFDAVVVGDELLCVANCKRAIESKTYVMRSQGLGCKTKKIEWKKTECSLSFFNREGRRLLYPIQL